MPRTKLPGPACATCRATSRRCDRAKPACGRCVSKQVECGGYPAKFRFCGLASRGKWKDRQAPTTDAAPEISAAGTPAAQRRMGEPHHPEIRDASSIDDTESGLDSRVQVSITHPVRPMTPPGEEQLRRMQEMEPRERQELQAQSSDTARPPIGDSPMSVVEIGSDSISSHFSAFGFDTDTILSFPADGSDTSGTQPPPTVAVLAVAADAFTHDQTDMLLCHYYSVICPHQIQQFPDETMNPYWAYILPLAQEQPGLLFAVLGLAANHLGRIQGDKHLSDTIAVEYRLRAIHHLSTAISKGSMGGLEPSARDAIFATIQILLLHDISECGISENGVHISGAVSICCQSLDTGGEVLSARHKRSIFFLGNLVWLDIIRAFAHPERLCFPVDVRETIIDLSDNKLEMVNGCPRDIILLIGEALDQAKAFSQWKIGREEYHRTLQAIIRKLYSWSISQWKCPNEDPLWLNVAEAYRHCCILRALRLLDPTQSAEDAEIQESVTAILDSASEIQGDNCLLELLVTPLFIAGADCLSPHSRHYILLRFAEIKARSQMANPVPSDLLRKVWAERSRKPKHDRKNVPWMSFTQGSASEGQHDYLIL